MFDSILFYLMLIILLGIVSQWLSWRYSLPAIVIMSVAGLALGPVFGIVDPQNDFGNLFQPIISIAVAIILFEGSLSLNFKEIKDLKRPIIRITTLGAFIAWLLGSAAAHYVAGLSWSVSLVIGGLFIVTGPTVILPLLRQAKLKQRTAAILKWEGIIVDPFGALLAVLAFEIVQVANSDNEGLTAFLPFFAASIFAVFLGWALGKGIGHMMERGQIPEFLKAPGVFVMVIACFTITDEIMHETGLLAVTAMGITMANMPISSLRDMRHFKENMSLLLISSIFVMLTASLTMDVLMQVFNWHIILFVILMMFIVRPLSIWLSTIGTDLTTKERALVGWIAPRGIVALTVSGYFAERLLAAGYEDAEMLTSLTFALVFATVCAHGFSISWLAKRWGLAVEDKPGILIVGSSSFTIGFAKVLQEEDVPVMIVEESWRRLRKAREADIAVYYGDLLSEGAEHELEITPYQYMMTATDDDAYNTLVSNTFIPEIGRANVYQLRTETHRQVDSNDYAKSLGGNSLFSEDVTWESLHEKMSNQYGFRRTQLTEQYGYEQYEAERDQRTIPLALIKKNGKIAFYSKGNDPTGEAGDTVVSLAPQKLNKNK
ncbi:cation:proton antiporter [Bacillus thermotolerans]|uniref:cation:proton antiporter n=1 Tax=Bacillus thermotolerans TaxID=1221996 RepID=UPI00057CCBE4|nr:sodium:proton antiporter [Bacillus thermotolerans]KKB36456.1 sodium/hydrogen exchanger family protein [Bacillus thermotolerans]